MWRGDGQAAVDGCAPDVTADLARLARACGVSLAYHPDSSRTVTIPAATVRAVLAAMGLAAGTPDQVRDSLAAVEAERWRRAVPPVTVVRQGQPASLPVVGASGAVVRLVVVPDDDPAFGGQATAPVELAIEMPAPGAASAESKVVGGRRLHRVPAALPDDLPLGWHRVWVGGTGAGALPPDGWLVVTPQRIAWPEALTRHRAWGVLAQLYSVRSRGSWGLGDWSDLAELGAALAAAGSSFIQVNPLCAAEPAPPLSESPYLPASRRFLNPVYIRPEAIGEFLVAPRERRAWVEALSRDARAVAGEDGLIDWDGVWAAKREALELIYGLPRTERRQRAFDEFRRDGGQALEDFALWCVLTDAGARESGLPEPVEVAPRSERAQALAAARADQITFFIWLQWIATQQAQAAQEVATRAGMTIGVIGDLPVGAHPAGADAWTDGGVLVRGVQMGAPPDGLSDLGQGWSSHPWSPRALAAGGYMAWRDLLRAAFATVGALRIDHILGLFRLWWIPEGNRPEDGTYVAYDHEAMLGILVLEATRAGALVIGEDLGVLEPGMREELAQRGVIGNTIVWFASDDAARDDGGSLTSRLRPTEHLAPERYREATMALLTTHDLPPTAAIVSGSHVDERADHGLLTGDGAAERATARARRTRMAAFLVEHGFLAEAAAANDDAVVAALHRYLLRTRSVLAGVSLVDLVGGVASQNLPGTWREYPNWRVPLRDAAGHDVLLEDLPAHPRVAHLLNVIRSAAAARR